MVEGFGKEAEHVASDASLAPETPLHNPKPRALLLYSGESVARLHLHHLVESGYQRLGQPKREDELRARHQKLRCQALEKGGRALQLHHVGDDPEAALRVLKVLVLYPSLDDVQGSRNDERCAGTGDRGDEVLSPGSRVVVAKFVKVFLCSGRTAEQLSHG